MCRRNFVSSGGWYLRTRCQPTSLMSMDSESSSATAWAATWRIRYWMTSTDRCNTSRISTRRYSQTPTTRAHFDIKPTVLPVRQSHRFGEIVAAHFVISGWGKAMPPPEQRSDADDVSTRAASDRRKLWFNIPADWDIEEIDRFGPWITQTLFRRQDGKELEWNSQETLNSKKDWQSQSALLILTKWFTPWINRNTNRTLFL